MNNNRYEKYYQKIKQVQKERYQELKAILTQYANNTKNRGLTPATKDQIEECADHAAFFSLEIQDLGLDGRFDTKQAKNLIHSLKYGFED